MTSFKKIYNQVWLYPVFVNFFLIYRYGHHEISQDIFSVLKDYVSSVHFHFWLTSLEELSKGETVLSGKDDLVARLSAAVTHYSKALASLKVSIFMAVGEGQDL